MKRRAWILLSISSLFLLACRAEEKPRFAALGLASASLALFRNQSIEIEFSQPLASGFQAGDALSLRDARGAEVPFRLRTGGSFLSLSPVDPTGWPKTPSLDLDILFPFPGASLRSQSGEELGAAFHRRIPIRPRYLRRPGVLRLLEHNLDGRERDTLDLEKPIRLLFNAPLDPRTLDAGIQVIAHETKRPPRLAEIEILIDSESPRVALIPPLSRQGALPRSGVGHEIRLTRALRSLDGREFIEGPSAPRIHFRTKARDRGTLVIRFQGEEDLAPSSAPAISGQGTLTPLGVHHPLVLPDRGQWDSFQGLFGRESSRAQILIQPPLLPSQPCLIEAIHFHLSQPLSSEATARALRVAVAYWRSEAPLDWDFAANEAQMVSARQLILTSAEAQGRVGLGLGGSPILTLAFSTPFSYDGSGRPLLLDLRNESGVEDPWGRPMILGVQGIGGHDESHATMLVRRGESRALRTSFLPRMIIQTLMVPPIVTRWYEIEGVSNPHFERQPGRDLVGDAVEGEDFVIWYQSGIPSPKGGYDSTSAWSVVPPAGSAPAVRLQFQFLPRVLRSNGDPRSIESVLLHYKEGQRRSPK